MLTFENKLGYIDKLGNWVIEPDFFGFEIYDLGEVIRLSAKGHRMVYFNRSGEILNQSEW